MSEYGKNNIMHFYCDESYIELEDKKHILVGIIAIKNDDELLNNFINLKRKLHINIFEEIKWHSNKYDEKKRIEITDEFLNMGCHWTGMILLEKFSENNIFLNMIKHIENYCIEENIPCYTLTIDENLISKKTQFYKLVEQKIVNKCIQFDIVDSVTNQLIQCVDLFVGFYNRLLFILDKDCDKVVLLSENSGYGMSVNAEISWMIKVGLRYKLWGEMISFKDDEIGPYKNSFGKGFTITESNISAELTSKIKDVFSKIYMGCIH